MIESESRPAKIVRNIEASGNDFQRMACESFVH